MTGFNRWLGAVAWMFAAIILFGSVYTGWHYSTRSRRPVLAVGLSWGVTGGLFGDSTATEAASVR